MIIHNIQVLFRIEARANDGPIIITTIIIIIIIINMHDNGNINLCKHNFTGYPHLC